MKYYETISTLTSVGAGTASTTTEAIHGELYKIIAIPEDSTLQPDNNFTITITSETYSTLFAETIFTDATVANNAATVWYPRAPAAGLTGAASVLTEVPPLVHGPLTVAGSAMGSGKVAYVKLVFIVP